MVENGREKRILKFYFSASGHQEAQRSPPPAIATSEIGQAQLKKKEREYCLSFKKKSRFVERLGSSEPLLKNSKRKFFEESSERKRRKTFLEEDLSFSCLVRFVGSRCLSNGRKDIACIKTTTTTTTTTPTTLSNNTSHYDEESIS